MAHLPVLVVGDVEEQLDPFQPYPLIHLPDEPGRWPLRSWREQYEKALADLGDDPSDEVDDLTDVAAVLTRRLGEDVRKVGPDEYVIERETNPDARFDYYSEGGWFEGALLRRDGEWVSHALKDEVDFEGMRRLARERAETTFAEFTAAVKGLERPLPRAAWLARRAGGPERDAALREEYLKIPWVAAASPFATSTSDVQNVFCLDAPDPRAAYVGQQVRSAGVSEALVVNGTWHSRHDLGDRARGNTSQYWAARFWGLLGRVSGDEQLTMVDCHV
ncbi:hypothetical protein [Nonomuraea pusilla]|uniref:Uncharacterized protein n=1 Tax=Nonomuraea pusilla TaxID=46177 RepID=A0A1H7IEV3_9ACTN|nr:hypothetical protein [Nonomuraea pusilla]SEK61026.1 hypothetical protein SAMN05660976_00783 [Nonomuraea pusilla]